MLSITLILKKYRMEATAREERFREPLLTHQLCYFMKLKCETFSKSFHSTINI